MLHLTYEKKTTSTENGITLLAVLQNSMLLFDYSVSIYLILGILGFCSYQKRPFDEL